MDFLGQTSTGKNRRSQGSGRRSTMVHHQKRPD